jgi:hypothetical protein
MSGAISPLPQYMPSWRGAHLKHRDNFTFTFTFTIKLTTKNIFSSFCTFPRLRAFRAHVFNRFRGLQNGWGCWYKLDNTAGYFCVSTSCCVADNLENRGAVLKKQKCGLQSSKIPSITGIYIQIFYCYRSRTVMGNTAVNLRFYTSVSFAEVYKSSRKKT